MKASAKTTPAEKMDDLKNRPENRKCFDCHEKVSFYLTRSH